VWRGHFRLTEFALCLSYCASGGRFRLSQCAPEMAIYCASGRSALRAATANGLCRWALPFSAILKEGSEREIPRTCRAGPESCKNDRLCMLSKPINLKVRPHVWRLKNTPRENGGHGFGMCSIREGAPTKYNALIMLYIKSYDGYFT
jgi:hypothetical protein